MGEYDESSSIEIEDGIGRWSGSARVLHKGVREAFEDHVDMC
jgi:hypothetical protein